ncbi:hypothetical protein BST33_09185 [Mycolicibacter minnesotensis]|uniref:DUF5078 domain-containing protein n=1 Tax=Mycolicibacter minnesotensis TaxID=1118379 RepID=A0AA91RMD1_9MYCO|nr:hypothetical protein BST33_09185 [Mycolicibacter minnesotensis]
MVGFGLRSAIATAMLTGALATAGVAAADATDDYPIPRRILRTPCTAEQIMAAARDVEPVYYERYMIDYHNKPVADRQAAQDSIHRFFAMDYAGRRQYAEDTATNAFFEPMSWRWPNWAKLFFNNKGVAARTTEICLNYPAGDMSVWDWR